MKLLIVEDEPVIARYIFRCCSAFLGDSNSIFTASSLQSAAEIITTIPIDLCLLDLNLNGEDGLRLLKVKSLKSFKTIVITANPEHLRNHSGKIVGVILKPFDEKHLIHVLKQHYPLNKT